MHSQFCCVWIRNSVDGNEKKQNELRRRISKRVKRKQVIKKYYTLYVYVFDMIYRFYEENSMCFVVTRGRLTFVPLGKAVRFFLRSFHQRGNECSLWHLPCRLRAQHLTASDINRSVCWAWIVMTSFAEHSNSAADVTHTWVSWGTRNGISTIYCTIAPESMKWLKYHASWIICEYVGNFEMESNVKRR